MGKCRGVMESEFLEGQVYSLPKLLGNQMESDVQGDCEVADMI